MHKKARKQFTEDKQNKDMDYWNRVLWSDETKINLFGSDGVKHVWWQPGEEYKDKCVLPTVKHVVGSVMVWGCMSAADTGELVHWGNHECQHILWHTEAEHDPLRRLVRRAIFQHDNFHCLANEAEGKGGLAKHFSDLNPIEHLWDIPKRKVEERKASNIHQLRDVIMWKRTPVATCEALVNFLPKRAKAVLKNNCGHTNIDTLGPTWKFSLRGVLTFVASGFDINGCVLNYFEGTANLHCYSSCTLITLHCSKVSFPQYCHMKRYNKIFTKMWGVNSLLWDTVYIYTNPIPKSWDTVQIVNKKGIQ